MTLKADRLVGRKARAAGRRLEWFSAGALIVVALTAAAGVVCHRVGRGLLHDELSQALYGEDCSRVRLLVQRGGNVDFENDSGQTPLGFAALNQDRALTDFLIRRGADVNRRNQNGENVLGSALNENGLPVVRRLFAAGVRLEEVAPGVPPLVEAASSADLPVVRELVLRGADVNAPDREGRPPVVAATSSADGLRKVRYLISHGARLSPAREGYAALCAAGGNEALEKWLLLHGTPVDPPNDRDWSALMYAVARRDEPTVRFLLRHGANPNRRTRSGWSPLFCARNIIRQPKMDRLLRAAGARNRGPDPQLGPLSAVGPDYASSPEPPEPAWHRLRRYVLDPR